MLIADRTVRDVTMSESQMLALARAAARTRTDDRALLQRLVEFWYANEATEQVLPESDLVPIAKGQLAP